MASPPLALVESSFIFCRFDSFQEILLSTFSSLLTFQPAGISFAITFGHFCGQSIYAVSGFISSFLLLNHIHHPLIREYSTIWVLSILDFHPVLLHGGKEICGHNYLLFKVLVNSLCFLFQFDTCCNQNQISIIVHRDFSFLCLQLQKHHIYSFHPLSGSAYWQFVLIL